MVVPFISPKPPPPGPYQGLNCEGSGQEPRIREGKPGRWATPAGLRPERGRFECFCWAEAPPGGWRLRSAE